MAQDNTIYLVPASLQEANDYLAGYIRQYRPMRGCKFSVGCALDGVSAPMRFCSFSPNRKCRKMAGKGVQPLHNYTCRFRPSSLIQADKSGLDGLQTGKLDSG